MMNQIIKNTIKSIYHIFCKVPYIGRKIKVFKEKRDLYKLFHEEKLLFNKHVKTSNSRQSIIFFTVHKCASIYVNNILRSLVKDVGMTTIDFETYNWMGLSKAPDVLSFYQSTENLYIDKGYYYGAFRVFNPAIENMDNFKIILMLRDPRDVLTSLYFSHAYSHEIPEISKSTAKNMRNFREKANKMTIDQYVMETSDDCLKAYQIYRDKILNNPNVLLVKYEEMVTNFQGWLFPIVEYLNLNVSKETVDKIINEANFNVKKEDIHSHKRQVTPGDHKRKLKSETIEKLNEKFKDILILLKYEI